MAGLWLAALGAGGLFAQAPHAGDPLAAQVRYEDGRAIVKLSNQRLVAVTAYTVRLRRAGAHQGRVFDALIGGNPADQLRPGDTREVSFEGV